MSSLRAQLIVVLAIFTLLLIHPFAQSQQAAPVPADPHELVTGSADVPASPAERAAALGLLERARQNADMHIAGSAPFILKAEFTAAGGSFTGPGEVTETWASGRNWRWTGSLGDYSQARASANGRIFDEQPVTVIPMRVQMLRAAIFNPVQGVNAQSTLRVAPADANGTQALCVLSTERASNIPSGTPRAWEEREYCVAKDTGLLQVYSEAPGVYVTYSYGQNLQFHGRSLPDEISIFIGGSSALTAHLFIGDIGSAGESLAAAKPPSHDHPIMLGAASRYPIEAQARSTSNEIQHAIVHVTTSSQGNLLEEELVSASDQALAQMALKIVKDSKFSPSESVQREAYINVRFSPGPEKNIAAN